MQRGQRPADGTRMRRLLIVAGCIGLVTICIPLAAAADPPEPVTIEGPSYFGNPGYGFFEATGLPECDSGTFQSPSNWASPSESVKPGYVRHIVREFTCGGSGHAFVLKVELRYNWPLGTPADGEDGFKRYPTLNWVMVDGDGPFEDLHMNGRGFVAGPLFDDGWNVIGEYDVFTGKAH